MKKAAVLCLALLCALGLGGCKLPIIGEIGKNKDAEPTPTPAPLSFDGEWRQSNSPSDQDYHGLYINDDYMEIYWILDSNDGAALYWAGTFTPPKKALTVEDSYEWESKADTSRTTNSLLTDKSASKKFKYEKGRITYEVDYEGVVMTVKAAPGSWGYGTKEYFGTTDMFDMVSGVFRDYLEEHPIPTEPPAEEQQETRELVPTPPEAPG